MDSPHGNIGLGGPGLYIIIGLLAATAIGALAVIVDAVRKGHRFGGPVSRVLWTAPQVLYLAALAWGFVPETTEQAAPAILALFVVAVPAQIAYVLRVVSPRRRGVAPPLDAEPEAVDLPDEGPIQA